MNDLISRQAAIDKLKREEKIFYSPTGLRYLIGAIRDLPSAQPEQPSEIQDILDYLDTALHPIISPEHWSVYSELHDMISTLPSAQQWIPCSERLPEKSGRYLVTRGLNACGSLWNRIYISNYSDLMGIKSEKIWWQGNVGKPDFKRLDDVIAWMPLPEPYKGE